MSMAVNVKIEARWDEEIPQEPLLCLRCGCQPFLTQFRFCINVEDSEYRPTNHVVCASCHDLIS